MVPLCTASGAFPWKLSAFAFFAATGYRCSGNILASFGPSLLAEALDATIYLFSPPHIVFAAIVTLLLRCVLSSRRSRRDFEDGATKSLFSTAHLSQHRSQALRGFDVAGYPTFTADKGGNDIGKRSEISNWWEMSCCWRSPQLCEELPSPANVAAKPGPLPRTNEAQLHPKFCGLRLLEPSGQLPPLNKFRPLPVEDASPSSLLATWDANVSCTNLERENCQKLALDVATSPGAKDAVTMLRFLRARKGSVEEAAKMYRSAMSWREGNGFERGFRLNLIDDSLHRRVDEHWPPTALLGTDRDGDPIYWNRMGLACPNFLSKAPKSFLGRHEVYSITRILQGLEERSALDGKARMYMTVVVDCADLGLRHLNLKAAPKYQHCVRIMEDNFPEMVKRVYIVRAPRIASAIWNVLSKFFDEGTKNKFQIVDGSKTFETLSAAIDPKWIPVSLGGRLTVAGNKECEPVLAGHRTPVPEDLITDLCAFDGPGC